MSVSDLPFILSRRPLEFQYKVCGSLQAVLILGAPRTKILALTLWSCKKVSCSGSLYHRFSPGILETEKSLKGRALSLGFLLLPDLGHLIFYCLWALHSLFFILYDFSSRRNVQNFLVYHYHTMRIFLKLKFIFRFSKILVFQKTRHILS